MPVPTNSMNKRCSLLCDMSPRKTKFLVSVKFTKIATRYAMALCKIGMPKMCVSVRKKV